MEIDKHFFRSISIILIAGAGGFIQGLISHWSSIFFAWVIYMIALALLNKWYILKEEEVSKK